MWTPTEEQRAIIEHGEGPAFVSASPGAGKTASITRRIAHLINQGVDPQNIVGITFTNKAANEMKERVRGLVDPRLGSKVWLSTFHSFCVRLLRSNPVLYGVGRHFGIADETDTKQLLTLAMARVSGKSEKEVRAVSGTGDVTHVRKWISKQKDILLTPDALKTKAAKDEHAVKFHQFIPFYAEYQSILRSNRLLDFDDLIMRTVLALKDNPQEQQFFADQLHYLMVDEYQDTNMAQFELVRLIGHIRKNVNVIGDLDQSIYRFRGADPKNSDRFFKAFPDTTVYLLQTNFRSVPGVAEVANRVIKRNTRKHPKQIITHKQGGDKPILVETENTDQEARFILATIQDKVRTGRYNWSDFAVIYRIRSLSRALEDEAVQRNIPHKIIGAINFYSRAAIKDILAYCRLLVYPHDDSAFTRIVNKPTRGIGPANFNRFAAIAHEHDFSLMKTMRKGMYANVVNGPATIGFRKLKAMYKHLRTIGVTSAAPVIEAVINRSGYMHFARSIKDPERGDRMVEDLQELIAAAETFDEAHRKKRSRGVSGFLEHAALMQQDDKEEEDNSVLMMTAHAAKGLEFKVVYCCGAVEGILPLKPRSETGSLTREEMEEHYQEERRVFFVAITRAEEELFLTYPKIRRFRDGQQECYPSRFCREAGDALDFVSMVEAGKRER